MEAPELVPRMSDRELEIAAAQRKATAALILSICGVVLVPVLCSVMGILFGLQAHRRLKAYPEATGGGQALAAIGLGVAMIVTVAAAFAVGWATWPG